MSRPDWRISRLLLSTQLPFLILVCLGLAGLTAIVVTAVALFRTIDTSGWDIALGIVRWLAIGYGWYLTARLLPMYIAHGQTRRAFLRQTAIYLVVAVAVISALLTAGFALEALIYDALDWTHRVSERRPYQAPDEYRTIVLTLCARNLAWALAGALLGAAFYRENPLPAIPIAGAVLAASTATVGDDLPFFDFTPSPSPTTITLYTAAIAVTAAVTWAYVRDLPVRTRST